MHKTGNNRQSNVKVMDLRQENNKNLLNLIENYCEKKFFLKQKNAVRRTTTTRTIICRQIKTSVFCDFKQLIFINLNQIQWWHQIRWKINSLI